MGDIDGIPEVKLFFSYYLELSEIVRIFAHRKCAMMLRLGHSCVPAVASDQRSSASKFDDSRLPASLQRRKIKGSEFMGQLAFLRMFILVAISLDVNDNRRHVHVFWKGKRHQHSLAKIWIEKNGEQCVEIADSELSAKDNEMLVAAINRHWEFINEQITRVFNGEKTISIDIEK